MTEEAKHVLAALSCGKLLLCTANGNRLVDPPKRPTFGQVPVSDAIARELLEFPGLLSAAEWDDRDQKLGLRSLGFTPRDYNEGTYYRVTQ